MKNNLESIRELLPYANLLESFIYFFGNEFGELKSREIINNALKSERAARFLRDTTISKRRYNHMSFVSTIQTSRNFLFSKSEVVCFGSLVLLERWRIEVGESLGLSNEQYLKKNIF